MAIRYATYAGERGRSLGAERAEDEGRLPLTRAIPEVARLAGCTRAVARVALRDTYDGEWHHTGNRARRTNYYCVQTAAEHVRPELMAEREAAEVREHREYVRARLIAQRDCSRPVSRHDARMRLAQRLDRARLTMRAAGRGITGALPDYGQWDAVRALMREASAAERELLARARELVALAAQCPQVYRLDVDCWGRGQIIWLDRRPTSALKSLDELRRWRECERITHC